MKVWSKYAQAGAAIGILAGPALFAWAIERPPVAPGGTNPPPVVEQGRTVAATGATLAAWSDAFANVAQTVRPSVVFIRADSRRAATSRGGSDPLEEMFRQFQRQNPDGPGDPQPRMQTSSGTGFIISNDGFILTNNHVVRDADRLVVTLFDGRTFPAKVVGRDAGTDVAVMRIEAKALPAVSFGNSDSVRVGEWVLAIGNPMGQQLSFTVTAGIVSAKGRGLSGLPVETRYGIQDFIQTDAAINPGNSGGPLVNAMGQVIGVNSAIASQTGSYEGYGFAIPSNLARRVVDELIAHGKVTRAILGLSIRAVDPEDADYAKLDKVTGVVVQDFSGNDSPAKRAGVQAGDVVIAVDGRPVEYVAQFQQSVAFRKPGEEVTLTVQRRGGEKADIKVRLVEAPSDEVAVAKPDDHGAASTLLSGRKLGATLEATQGGDGPVGLVVTSVDPDGPAAEKLIDVQTSPRSPDIITEANGTALKSVDDLEQVLKNAKSGDVISLRVFNQQFEQQRGGSRIVRMRTR